MSALAADLTARGELQPARELLEQVVATAREVYGDQHATTAEVMYQLANLAMRQGDLDRAGELYADVATVVRSLAGPGSPAVRMLAHHVGTLAELQRRLGSPEQAARLEAVVSDLAGPPDPDEPPEITFMRLTASTADLLAALATSRQQHGDEHLQTLALIFRLAGALLDQDDYRGAVELLEPALPVAQRVAGADSDLATGMMLKLGYALHPLGETPRARQLLEEALAISRRVHGDGHLLTRQVHEVLRTVPRPKVTPPGPPPVPGPPVVEQAPSDKEAAAVVFISHARETCAAHAGALRDRLRSAGVAAFLDPAGLDYGEGVPAGVLDVLLRARVVVAFADPAYFTRRSCVEQLSAALAAYRAVHRDGGRRADAAEARLPIVVGLGPDGQRGSELAHLPPELQDTKWPLVDETELLAGMVLDRLGRVGATFEARLERLGELRQLQDRLREAMLIPPVRSLASTPLYHELGLPESIGDGFVGRSELLWEMHRLLTSRRIGAAALGGGPGFGKTRLALEYLHRFGAESYPGGVLWVDADVSTDALTPQLHGVLQRLRPQTPDLLTFQQQGREVSAELGQALRERPGSKPVLYVVDGLPEPSELIRYCPAPARVSLLVTSRVRQEALANLPWLEVAELSEESAVRLLAWEVGARQALAEDAWREIARWAGGLPLTLELLNALLRSGAMSAGGLLEASRSVRARTTRSRSASPRTCR